MLKRRRFPILLVSASVAVFIIWSFLFRGNEALRFLGIDGLRLIIGTLSFVWLVQACRRGAGKQRLFWLLLSAGVLLYIAVSTGRIYLQLQQNSVVPTDSIYVMWLLSYCFFLAALLYKTKELSSNVLKKSYLFNMLMFMITAAAVIIHYLITPVLARPEASLAVALVTIIYPVIDLGILFALTVLYYQSQQSRQKSLMLYIVFAFFILVATDFAYSYLSIQGYYGRGIYLELFWMISILLIGLAGFYSREAQTEELPEITNLFEGKSIIFPYAAILALVAIVISNYQIQFNALSTGLLISFLMMLGRQLLIIRTNEKLMEEFKYLAFHDTLTGLNNRVCFKDQAEKILNGSGSRKAALLLIDLDRFKVINDTLGHDAGDQVLIKAARRLMDSMIDGSSVYRLGGDEFVIIVEDASEQKCAVLAENIVSNFRSAIMVESYEISVTPSIGISMYPAHGKTSEDLLKYADAAMYLSKENGKNQYSFYDTELHRAMSRKMIIETELQKAVDNNQFSLHYQPKVDMEEQTIAGVEALLRWNHPSLGMIAPDEFIPIAEETGQIVPIGEWVLETACRQNKVWQRKGHPPFSVSVNISMLQFQQGEFLKTVSRVLADTGLAPGFLELEITEGVMKDTAESIEILAKLRSLGVKISIDDFGTGYSSLHILPKLPIDTIKIDKSFIDDLENPSDHSMMKAIIDLGLALGLTVIAEGVETDEQKDILLENNCRFGQGYLFSKPLPADRLESLLWPVEVLSS